MTTSERELVSAHDVARELAERLPNLGEVKLHKLLYYCQGWHLAWTGVPLFAEPIEAWANGPVVAKLWRDRKYNELTPERHDLDAKMLGTIGYVVSRYGLFNGSDLIRLTHTESPWRNATENSGEDERPDEPITHESLRAYFSDKHADPSVMFADQVLGNSTLRELLVAAEDRVSRTAPQADTRESIQALLEAN